MIDKGRDEDSGFEIQIGRWLAMPRDSYTWSGTPASRTVRWVRQRLCIALTKAWPRGAEPRNPNKAIWKAFAFTSMPQRGVQAERRAGGLHGMELPRDVLLKESQNTQRADAQAYVSLRCRTWARMSNQCEGGGAECRAYRLDRPWSSTRCP